MEQYLKLDMAKWLKVLRHLELLPRPLSQDWSSVFLQKFDGNITIWPKTNITELRYILSDPSEERLANMLIVGQRCTFPKLKFVSNRLRIERLVERGRQMTRSKQTEQQEHTLTERENLDGREPGKVWKRSSQRSSGGRDQRRAVSENGDVITAIHAESPSARFSSWLSRWNSSGSGHGGGAVNEDGQRDLNEDDNDGYGERPGADGRRSSLGDTFKELENQGRVLFDDDSEEFTGSSATSEEGEEDEEEKEGEVEVEVDGERNEGEGEMEVGQQGVEKFQAGGMGGVVGVMP